MSASAFARTEVRPDRSSDAPLVVDTDAETDPGDHTGSTHIAAWFTSIAATLTSRIPRAWLGMSGYLFAGVLLGLVIIVATFSYGASSASSTAGTSAGVVTDDVVHLEASQIGQRCWRGTSQDGPTRITVSLEVGLDGKVRNARAAGESPAMRACIEAHVKAWEFLPQASPSQMVLPIEIDRR